VAVDRGYNDFRLFARWIAGGVFFVTRPMHHMVYEVIQLRQPPPTSNIVSDEIIRFTSKKAQQTCKHQLRRIVVWDEAHARTIVLVTNHLGFGATTLANIYKDRWEIELFFKALKQNLKIKSFVGTTENALHIQIWTALIAILLLKWLHHLSQANWSFSNLATMLRLNLFTYRDLRDWLHNPFGTPPIVPEPQQLALSLA
jgi:IS4 transposase